MEPSINRYFLNKMEYLCKDYVELAQYSLFFCTFSLLFFTLRCKIQNGTINFHRPLSFRPLEISVVYCHIKNYVYFHVGCEIGLGLAFFSLPFHTMDLIEMCN